MRALTLLYHDVVRAGDWESSGFPGAAAASYKLELGEFERHLAAISAAVPQRQTVPALLLAATNGAPTVLLTFDDGGASAHSCVADLLEAKGWRGHFLVTTDYLDTPGFLTRLQVRDLAARGHVIGTHSCSHLTGMSGRSPAVLREEWARSAGVLADLVGAAVRVGSVPFGAFSRRVAAAAGAAGLTTLFTSEPTTRCSVVDGCLVVGRYTVRRDTPARVAARLAAGARSVRLRQFWLWNLKKVAKALGGDSYLKMRDALFES